jgi:membrane-associated phospholipid phosphatase
MDIATTTTRARIKRRDLLRIGVAGAGLGAAGVLARGVPIVLADDKEQADSCGLVEPGAGNWRTWVLSSGREVALAPPPGEHATKNEIEQLKGLASQRNAVALDRINYWNAGAPSYHWVKETVERANAMTGGLLGARNIALANVAMYDALIAAWHWKYAYARRRPSQRDAGLTTVIPNPLSPSYPSEYATVASAAATVLSSVLTAPYNAGISSLLDEAVHSRLVAGVEYPSDVAAGLWLGQQVGQLVLQRRAATDHFTEPWDGILKTDPGSWYPAAGTVPIGAMARDWSTWVVKPISRFRPVDPPAYLSAAFNADFAEVRDWDRRLNGANFDRNAKAFVAQTPDGVVLYWYATASQHLVEDRHDGNPPRAARAYALMSIAWHDAMVTCFEAKYHWWRIRPFQAQLAADSAHPIPLLFPTPNHPSYPAAHGTGSGAIAAMMAHLFPRDAASITDRADINALSRLWAGIHYRTDIVAGLKLGRDVAAAIIEAAANDGSGDTVAASAQQDCEQEGSQAQNN